MSENESMIPESYLLAFERYMREKTGDPQCGIVHNNYIDSNTKEGYKSVIANETRAMTEQLFGVKRDKEPDDSEIIAYTNKILEKCGNLVNWRVIDAAREKVNNPENKAVVAAIIREIMCGINPARAYDDAAGFFGYQFPLLAYLFFVKNSNDYLPISPRNFDACFRMFGKSYIDCPTLSLNGSWKVYCAFIHCVGDVKRQLLSRYPDDNVALLDAHSVLWIMCRRQFLDFYNNIDEPIIRDARAKETDACAKARIGQGAYRAEMLDLWGGGCSVTGCSLTGVLTASHAKPWKQSSSDECRDKFNGLILTPNLDRLFDRGLISFDEDGKIIISSQLDSETLELLGVSQDMRLRFIKEQHLPYLKYHRNKIFQR